MLIKVCKECGKKISKKAEVCPYCGVRNKSSFFKKFIIVWISIILIVTISLIGLKIYRSYNIKKHAKQDFIKQLKNWLDKGQYSKILNTEYGGNIFHEEIKNDDEFLKIINKAKKLHKKNQTNQTKKEKK